MEPATSAFSTIITLIQSLVEGMLAVGTSLVTWIMDTPLALLGIILFVLVFFISGIRKLIPGV